MVAGGKNRHFRSSRYGGKMEGRESSMVASTCTKGSLRPFFVIRFKTKVLSDVNKCKEVRLEGREERCCVCTIKVKQKQGNELGELRGKE